MRRILPLLFLLFALLLTWPLVLRLGSHLPQGSESTATVPYFNLWTLGWNAQSLERAFADYWQAPIFFPAPGSFAFSDPQTLTALPAALIWPLSPALAYNSILLLYLALDGWTAYRLLRRRGVPLAAALMGGLLIQSLPFLTHERGVLQLQPLFGPLWAIDAAWSLFDNPNSRAALSLSLAVVVTYMTSEYYALALVPALVLLAAVRGKALLRRKLLAHLLPAAALAMLAVSPVALPQNAALQAMGFRRSAHSLEKTSAQLVDYLRPSARLRLAQVFEGPHGGSGQRLYPGLLLTSLGLLGTAFALRRPKQRRWGLFLLGMMALGFLLSLGTNLELLGRQPLLALHQQLSLLRYTRSPFRFAILLQMGLALGAAQALAALRPRLGRGALLLGLLAALELAPGAEPLAPMPPADPLYRVLDRSAQGAVTAHLPWAPGSKAADFENTTAWMVQSLDSNLRLLNGYSGFFPAQNHQLRHLLEDFPSQGGIMALQALGVDLVIIHQPDLAGDSARLEEWQRQWPLRLQARSAQSVAFTLLGAQYSPLETFEGQFALRYRQRDGRHRLEALPIVQGEEAYVYASGAPFPWRLRLSGPRGELALNPAPPNVLLFYHGSSDWLVLAQHLDLPPGDYQATLVARDTGRPVGEMQFTISP